jgi:hypothetical protein
VGFQGFPWSTGDKPEQYLNHEGPIALARELQVHTVWFNTGTAESYSGKSVPAAVRRTQLLGALAQAETVKAAGFDTRINLFAFQDPDVSWRYAIKLPSL